VVRDPDLRDSVGFQVRPRRAQVLQPVADLERDMIEPDALLLGPRRAGADPEEGEVVMVPAGTVTLRIRWLPESAR
jgi:hypothetical protein